MTSILLSMIIIFVCVGMPLLVARQAFLKKQETQIEKVISFIGSISLAVFLAVLVPWSGVSSYLRWPFIILILFSSAYLMKIKPLLKPLSLKKKILCGLNFFVSISLLTAALFGFIGFQTEERIMGLEFPLRNGRYFVGQGGSSVFLNHHWGLGSQSFALDILKLNKIGSRSNTLFPQKNNHFEIYNDIVYSPCAGTVKKVRDFQRDMEPFNLKSLKNLKGRDIIGNRIVIECENFDVLLAHLLPKTILVKKGDQIELLQELARVGNSGNSTEPHLHFQIQSKSNDPDDINTNTISPIPMSFNNRFLVRNSVITCSLKICN
jgi:hypothetical protein